MNLPTQIVRPAVSHLTWQQTDVMRCLGYKPGKTHLTPTILPVLEQGIALGLQVARPVASLAYCGVDAVQGSDVSLTLPRLHWQSAGLARLLRQATGATLMVVTLGAGIDEQIRDLFLQQEYAVATVVDAVGTVLVHALLQHMRDLIAVDAARFALGVTEPFCPGYADWDLHDLPGLVEAGGGEAIHVCCNEASCLLPLKSAAAIVGWVAQEAKSPASGCKACHLVTCEYRRGVER